MSDHIIGQVLAGGYLILDIKSGGMGVVYICHQPSTGRYYAIKTVRAGVGLDDEEFLRRFREEVNNWIRISSQAHHKNIVDALLYHEDERWLFLEYVDGPHLHDLTHKQIPHVGHALAWGLDIAEGTRTLHERFKLLHRDLKPRNVLVTQDGLIAKITDLGIGKVLQENVVAETMVGTPGYMAPETMRGESDFRSDIFSFGAVLYRLLTGTEPFGRGLPVEGATLLPPSERNPHVPPALNGIVARCLASQPRDRYQRFAEVIADLEAVKGSLPDKIEGYRYCTRHSFHAPVGAGIPECHFCDHDRRREELLEKAETMRDTAGTPVDAATLVYGGPGTPASSRTPQTAPTLVVPSKSEPTLTEGGAARAGVPTPTLTESKMRRGAGTPSGGADAATMRKSWVKLTAFALAGVLVAGGAYWMFGGSGANPDTKVIGAETSAGDGETAKEEKNASALLPEILDKLGHKIEATDCYRPHRGGSIQTAATEPQAYCPDCSSFYCQDCSKRFDGWRTACDNCGGNTIKKFTAQK